MTTHVHGRRFRRAPPGWRGLAAMLAIVGLLAAFDQVVRGSVQQGEARRKATAALADAMWRCKVPGPARARVDCLARIGPAGPPATAPGNAPTSPP